MDSPQTSSETRCTCRSDGKPSCRHAFHEKLLMDQNKFVDKNGDKILHGDRLRYVNPKFPHKKHPLVTAIVRDDDCFILFDGGKITRAKDQGRWQSERFELVTSNDNPRIL